MVDALGVIAIGVGGLEAESVMLGRASWMRLPDIIGVELTGKPQPGITATDIVLALTEFLRKQKVVSSYLEFFGEGAVAPDAGRPRHDLQHGARIRRHRRDVLHRRANHQVPEPDRPRRRHGASWSRPTQRTTGLWADSLADAPNTSACCQFDLSSVVRNIAGPSNPHKRVPTSELAARGISRRGGKRTGPDARRRRHHRRHHQLHQHQQPAQHDRRRPDGAQRQPRSA